MLLLKGHTGKVGSNALAYSPDGRLLASGSADGTLKLWDLARGAARFTLALHTNLVTGVGFALGGSLLVTASWDRTVRFWDVATGKQRRRFDARQGVDCLAVAPDGRTVATAGGNRWFGWEAVSLWHVGEAPLRVERMPAVGEHTSEIGAVAFDPLGRYLASGAADRTARVWRLPGGEPAYALTGRAWIQGLAFSPDGGTLAVAAGKQVSLHDAETGREKAVLAYHRRQVLSAAFSPDGRTLVSGSKDGSVCCWDVASGKPGQVYRWRIGPVEAVAFAPDGMTAAAGGQANVVVWDIDE